MCEHQLDIGRRGEHGVRVLECFATLPDCKIIYFKFLKIQNPTMLSCTNSYSFSLHEIFLRLNRKRHLLNILFLSGTMERQFPVGYF